MKILLLTTHLNIGGVAVYTVNLAKGLKKKGHTVYVASSGGELEKVLNENGISHLKLNVGTKFEFHPKLIFALLKLFKFIKENNIDIVHSQTRVTQVMAYFLSRFTAVAYVSTCHGFFKKTRLSRRLFGGWGKHVIAISDPVKKHLIRDLKVKEKNISLIYNGVEVEKFSHLLTKDEGDALKNDLGFGRSPVVGSVSRLSPVKGLPYLLFAMKDLIAEIPDARLLLVGEGPSKDYLKELAKKIGIDHNVFFALNTTETERFLSIIDVFVFYSLEEGLGLSLLEALASGRPCIASSVGGVSSVIEDGLTGILVPPKDTHALKEAILKVLKDNNLRASLAARGVELVRKKFSLEKMTDEVINVYEKALTQ